MRYTIAAIVVIAAGLLTWVVQRGSGADTAIMIVAIVTVTFFASLGNLWNSIYLRSKAKGKPDRSNATVIRLPDRSPPHPPAPDAAPQAHEHRP